MKRPQWIRFAAFVMVLAVLLGYVVYHRGEPKSVSAPTGSAPAVSAQGSTAAQGVQALENYFVNYRAQRDRVMSQEIATLQNLLKEPGLSSQAKAEATKTLVRDTQEMKQEMEVERLLSARGFPLAAATITQSSAVVVVGAAQLTESQIAQIADAVMTVTHLQPENIVIMPKASG
ncbi:MAG: SpoIIIAH-like family protein [Firmicutes bacterium]|nr:SpoIIIAH-like family protein [Alicyclobacillaceae bacterium]MCL6496672.1 SpoIIIAH-like family protein [Bacillota bacterium]